MTIKISALFFFLLLLAPSAQARIYIDITQVSEKSFPVALVPLVRDGGTEDPEGIGARFTKLVEKDLKLMGVFRFISESAYLENPKKLAYKTTQINFASWAVLDTLALVKGWYRIEGTQITVEPHLFDVLLQKELSAKQYKATKEQLPSIAHRFANEVMRVLTGQEGIFDTKIAFIGKTGGHKELFVMDFNGENRKQLTHDRSIVLSPRWSPDGRSIYYTSFKKGGVPQLYEYNLEKRRSNRKTRLPGMVIGLDISPLENAMVTTLTKDGNSEIYRLTMSGRIDKRLTRNYDIDVSATFSPDGKDLVFVSDRDGSPQIYKMDREGKSPTRLTFKGRNNTDPAWSPAEDKIAFAGMDTDGHFDIFSTNLDGSNLVRLTYDTRNNDEPAWSPDGQLLTFASNRTGRYQIYVMRPDGSHQVRLTHKRFHHYMPAWGPKPK